MFLKSVFFCGILLLLALMKKNHSLSILLTLESIVLVTLMALVVRSEMMFSVCYLSVGACEAAVGLSCLVGLVRFCGKEYVSMGE
uniref:NADH dehydrogenase subunit 4L n=1 Tax=Parasagitta setosa TaxID=366441 RepID=A0A141CKH8_9BILA|nr:NADH dehydrogenase subunit 4L [Parasagitta setosa]